MRKIALIVDDVELNRELLGDMLEDSFDILEASDGTEALALIQENLDRIAVILLDLIMPETDGYTVLNEMREKGWLSTIPVLIISSEDVEAERVCFEMGATDYVRKPFDERIVRRRVKNNSELFMYKNQLEEKVEEQTKTLKRSNEILKAQAKQLESNNENIIEILGAAVEARNMESGQHVKRVKNYTAIIAEEIMNTCPEYGLTEEINMLIAGASPLHDIGKMCIPDSILLKPGKLTPEEWDTMKTHTTKGEEILATLEDKWDKSYYEYSRQIIRHHHERYDGRGYPDGLVGDEIPIAAQIVSLADVYDALINDRPYKKAFSKETAREMILNGECGAFNEKILACLHKLP